jgi:hypothetical protein
VVPFVGVTLSHAALEEMVNVVGLGLSSLTVCASGTGPPTVCAKDKDADVAEIKFGAAARLRTMGIETGWAPPETTMVV